MNFVPVNINIILAFDIYLKFYLSLIFATYVEVLWYAGMYKQTSDYIGFISTEHDNFSSHKQWRIRLIPNLTLSYLTSP
jgi:hypothetical protein